MTRQKPDSINSLLSTPFFYFILHPSSFILLIILLFAIFFSLLAVQQHQTYQTNGFDLGNVDQALWNTAQGRFLYFTLMTPIQSRLALHVEPILLAFVPFYWLGLGGPKLLLITQAVVVAAGAWPLYQLAINNEQLAKGKLNPTSPISHPISHISYPTSHISHPTSHIQRYLFLIFPLAYLLLPTLQSAVLFDFHAVTLAPTFLLFAFLALERGQNRRFFFFIALAMACKEDMPLVVAMLGLYAGLVRRRWRLAGITIGLSAAWFVVAVFVIQPYFAIGGNIQLDRYAWLGDSPAQMIQTAITQPGLVFNHVWHQADLPGYLTALFFPTAFLALFNPFTLLPMLPTLAVNLLSNNPFTWRLEDFHYGAPLAPFLLISAIYAIRRISRWMPSSKNHQLPITTLFTLLLLTFSLIYHYHRGFTPPARPFNWPEITPHHRQLETILQTIPPDTPLFAQSNLAPHLTHRKTIYSDFAYFTDPGYPVPESVQDIILDITAFENFGGLHQFLQSELLTSDEYRLITAQDGILHFKPINNEQLTLNNEKPSTPNNQLPITHLPTPFYSFAQPNPPSENLLQLDFGDVLRLHGYSLHFNRQEEVQVTVDVELLRPSQSVQPVLYLLNAEGRPVGATTDLQPALVWYPVEQWPVGETVRVHFNTLPWYTRETQAYRLALGVISGSDVLDMSQRHHPTISQSTEFALRLPADGTLVELAYIEQNWNIPEGGPQQRQFTRPILPNAIQANFANQIELFGHSSPQITNNQLLITDNQPPQTQNPKLKTLTITLGWQAINTPQNLTRFVQLVGPDGRVYGQNDSAPDFGNYPTNYWQPGEVVVETVSFSIEAQAPTGDYTLHLGFYSPDTGQRVLLTSGADHLEISVHN